MAFDLTKLDRKSFPDDPALAEALGVGFVLRRSRALDKIEVGTRQLAMLRGMSVGAVNQDASELAYMIAALATVMISPKEFEWDAVGDDDDIRELYAEWVKWNASFRRVRAGESE
jgi:hypothetical protein